MYPYKFGDQWSAREANKVVSNNRNDSGIRQNLRFRTDVTFISPVDLPAYSAFGLGSDAANRFNRGVQSVMIPDPIGSGMAPFYTNSQTAISAGKRFIATPIWHLPTRLKVNGTFDPGDMGAPNDAGEVESGSGLLCVSDTSSGYASFVAAGSSSVTPRGVLTSGTSIAADGKNDGLLQVEVQRQKWDGTAFVTDGKPVTVTLTFYGVRTQAVNDEHYGIAIGDVINGLYEHPDHGWVCDHCIYTGVKHLQVFEDCNEPVAQFASIGGDLPITDIGAGYTDLTGYTTNEVTPRGLTTDLAAGTITFGVAGVYQVTFSVNMAGHNSSNNGRTTYLRLYDTVGAAPIPGGVAVGIGRNTEDTFVSGTFLAEISGPATARLQIGGGDAITGIVVFRANYQASYFAQ